MRSIARITIFITAVLFLFTAARRAAEISLSVAASSSSTDIMLFKGHPEAISARNLLKCEVIDMFDAGNRVGVDLDCGGGRLVAEVVKQAVEELGIKPGSEVYAAIKVTSFRKLG